MTTTTPRIYVVCLASYNAGKLHGTWIDCDQDADDINAEIATMLRKSPCPNVMVDDPDTGEQVPSAEEWAIHDSEGFGAWKVSEHESIESLADYAAILDELDDSEVEAFQAWIDNQGSTTYDIDSNSLDEFRENYQGCHEDLADYAQQWCEDTGRIPKDLPSYIHIDWESTGRDFELGGDIWTHQGEHGLHVFYNS